MSANIAEVDKLSVAAHVHARPKKQLQKRMMLSLNTTEKTMNAF